MATCNRSPLEISLFSVYFCALSLLAVLMLPVLCPEAHAAQIRESDLTVSSQVGKVRTEAEGQKTGSRALVHSVDIRREAHTGEVHVTGKAGGVTTQAGGQNSNAASAVGGVTVGDK